MEGVEDLAAIHRYGATLVRLSRVSIAIWNISDEGKAMPNDHWNAKQCQTIFIFEHFINYYCSTNNTGIHCCLICAACHLFVLLYSATHPLR